VGAAVFAAAPGGHTAVVGALLDAHERRFSGPGDEGPIESSVARALRYAALAGQVGCLIELRKWASRRSVAAVVKIYV
jgi:hypothetical protein